MCCTQIKSIAQYILHRMYSLTDFKIQRGHKDTVFPVHGNAKLPEQKINISMRNGIVLIAKCITKKNPFYDM